MALVNGTVQGSMKSELTQLCPHLFDASISQRCRVRVFQLCFEFSKEGVFILIIRCVSPGFLYPINGRFVVCIQRLDEPRICGTTSRVKISHIVKGFIGYLEAIVCSVDGDRRPRVRREERRQLTPGAEAEEPKSKPRWTLLFLVSNLYHPIFRFG